MADDPATNPEAEADAAGETPSDIAPDAAADLTPPPEAAASAAEAEPTSSEAPVETPAVAEAGGNTIGQDELDQLRAQFEASRQSETPPKRASVSAPAPPPPPPPPVTASETSDDDLMAQMAAAIAADDVATAPPEAPAAAPRTESADAIPAIPYHPTEFELPADAASAATIELLDDVELEVRVELGRTDMYIEDVLKLGLGSVIELDKLAGDPVDIYVNRRLVARGEVIVLNDNFCVRISNIHSPIPELETA